MAERGVDIKVAAPGAKETAQDLQSVAAAAGQVGQAAQQAAPATAAGTAAQGKAADGARLLREENRALVQSLRHLGPEAAAVADAIAAMTLKMGPAAMMTGLIGAAILGVVTVMRQYSAAQEQQRREAQQVLDALVKQAEAYTDIGEAMEKSRAIGRAPGVEPSAAVIARLAAAPAPLGRAGVEFGARAMAGLREPMAPEEARAFAAFIASGLAQGMEPAQAMASFRAQYAARGPALIAELDAELRALGQRMPEAVARRRHEQVMMIPADVEAEREEVLYRRVAERETLAGRARSAADIRRHVERITAGAEMGLGWHRADLEMLLRSYPDLGELPQVRPVVVNQGGVHIHNYGYEDPAGIPSPERAGNTGR